MAADKLDGGEAVAEPLRSALAAGRSAFTSRTRDEWTALLVPAGTCSHLELPTCHSVAPAQ